MCEYEMDPMSIVEDTEQTQFCQQTDRVKPVYPPFNFVETGGYNNDLICVTQPQKAKPLNAASPLPPFQEETKREDHPPPPPPPPPPPIRFI